MSRAAGCCCATAGGLAAIRTNPINPMMRRITACPRVRVPRLLRRTIALLAMTAKNCHCERSEAISWLFAFCRAPQRRQVGAHAGRVDPVIAAADPRFRADVDPAAGLGGGDADHDVVGEAEPAAAVAGLDAPFGRIARDNGPAHLPGGGEGAGEGL